MCLRLRSIVMPGFRLTLTGPASDTWFSFSRAVRIASRASETTCAVVTPFVADRFELDAVLRSAGTGGGGVGPLEVAVELGIGRRPTMGVSDRLLIAFGAEMLDVRLGSSMVDSAVENGTPMVADSTSQVREK